jgi:tRNA modification GTPase
VARSRNTLRVADLVVVMLDRSRPLSDEDRDVLASTANQRRVIVSNKSDLPAELCVAQLAPLEPLELSATTGSGIATLIDAIAETLTASEPLRDQPQITNTRHIVLLERARASLKEAAVALENEVPEEFPLLDLQEAAHALQEITGQRTSDDLLHHIFARFCIGK